MACPHIWQKQACECPPALTGTVLAFVATYAKCLLGGSRCNLLALPLLLAPTGYIIPPHYTASPKPYSVGAFLCLTKPKTPCRLPVRGFLFLKKDKSRYFCFFLTENRLFNGMMLIINYLNLHKM
ncbi:hypothetical protein LJC61_09940 [Ruminococcaceae bacterium OttesenSCG-928-A16]|nr:hypothetical protein [Ruminococcaceae bacterium OttesenSCG-928-A16]